MWPLLRPALRRITTINSTGRIRHPTTLPTVPAVEVTPSCIARLRALSAAKGHEVALRVMVDGGGCSGFQYVFTLEDANAPTSTSTHEEEEQQGVTIVKPADDVSVIIDNLSLEFLSGAKVDYVEEMISSSFRVVDNPNSESSCGCGVSFSAK